MYVMQQVRSHHSVAVSSVVRRGYGYVTYLRTKATAGPCVCPVVPTFGMWSDAVSRSRLADFSQLRHMDWMANKNFKACSQ